MLGQLVSKKILPTVFGVAIPNFAYMIIFAALADIFNLIPQNLREACRRCQHFCGNKLVCDSKMVGMGISAINFSTMFSVASWQNVVIVLINRHRLLRRLCSLRPGSLASSLSRAPSPLACAWQTWAAQATLPFWVQPSEWT